MFDDFKRISLEACVLVAFGALFGLTLNYQLVIDAFSGRLAPVMTEAGADLPQGRLPTPVMLEEVRELIASHGLVVDARSVELFESGHIKGSVSLPLNDIEALLPEFLAAVAKEEVIVIYCSGFGCPDSFDLGMRLIEEGYLDVRVFEGGFPEWRDAGMPVEGKTP